MRNSFGPHFVSLHGNFSLLKKVGMSIKRTWLCLVVPLRNINGFHTNGGHETLGQQVGNEGTSNASINYKLLVYITIDELSIRDVAERSSDN